jgi:hypothetical protein
LIARYAIWFAAALIAMAAPPRSFAQRFERRIAPFDVIGVNGPIVNPFSGGLLQPRIGLRDVDRDGRPDIFTLNPDFRLRLYHNEGDLRFRRVFPSPYDSLPVVNWFRFADIDGDGDDDVLTAGGTSEVLLYKNIGTQAAPSFSSQPDTLRGADGFEIFTQKETVPSLVDLDADGDLDYLMGNLDGTITFYENTGSATAPVFTYRTANFKNIQVISSRTNKDAGASPLESSRHGASVLGFTDLDGDQDLDILFGDFFTRRLLHFNNFGTPKKPEFSMTRLDTAFRPNGDDVDSEGFNQAEGGDLDGDGDTDVLVSSLYPNATTPPIILYRNEGTPGTPIMRTASDNPTSEIDEGTFAALAPIHDSQRNGVLIGSASVTTDASIGTVSYYETSSLGDRTVWTFRETFGIPGWARTSVAAGDLDGDGIAELVVGGVGGQKLKIMKFQGSRLVDAPWTIDDFTGINTNTSPALTDLDGDGDLDLLVGAENGGLFYFENFGDASAPQFARSTPPPPFDTIRVGKDSAPRFFDLDGDGDMDVVIGNRAGGALGGKTTDGVQFFLNEGDHFAKSASYPDIDLPLHTNPTPMMLALPEGTVLFLGVEAGGVEAYLEQDAHSGVSEPDESATPDVAVVPSLLTGGERSIELRWHTGQARAEFTLSDPTGRQILHRTLPSATGTARIELPQLATGLYLYSLRSYRGTTTGKILVVR